MSCPSPSRVPDEAPAEQLADPGAPAAADARPRGAVRGIWFVFYIGDYGWLTLAPTLFTDKGYSLADSTTYLIASGIGFLVGAYATTHFTDRIERKYSAAVIAWCGALRCS